MDTNPEGAQGPIGIPGKSVDAELVIVREELKAEEEEANEATKRMRSFADFFKQFSTPGTMLVQNREQRRLASRQMKIRSKRKRRARK